ncbi:hypothetical protein HQ584_03385 [Patescibacteria group bacterium]|nr:hypothetical protein [Patescibacteria group bacterium]
MKKLELEPLPSSWGTTKGPLQDGWYFWIPVLSSDDFECLEICNGVIIDTRPKDSHGVEWEQYEHTDYSGYWMGPIKPPV